MPANPHLNLKPHKALTMLDICLMTFLKAFDSVADNKRRPRCWQQIVSSLQCDDICRKFL